MRSSKKKIKLTNCDKYILVDYFNYERVNIFKWHMGSRGYPKTSIWDKKQKKRWLIDIQKFLMGWQKNKMLDHINGDKLDNRVSNLRWCSNQQNQHNQHARIGGSSKYKGVVQHKTDKSWQAQLTCNNKAVYIGRYKKEEDAARAYNSKALELFGEFANINKIDNLTYEESITMPKKPESWGYSKFRGVSWNKNYKKWQAGLMINRKYKYLGSFDTELEAKKAYEKFKGEV